MNENSAELEAERILEAEYAKAMAEECPNGESCAVHFRVDEEYFEEEEQYARLITYLGDMVVITEDNHKYENPYLRIKLMTGLIKNEDLPPRWETVIFKVGPGVVADLEHRTLEERREALRYSHEHDDWENVAGVHWTTVTALKSGLIDVSKPYELGEG